MEKSKGSVLHERLSVFWGTPATLRGRPGGRPLSRARSVGPARERPPARRQRRCPPRPAHAQHTRLARHRRGVRPGLPGRARPPERRAGRGCDGGDPLAGPAAEPRCPPRHEARALPGALSLHGRDRPRRHEPRRRRLLPPRRPRAEPRAGGRRAGMANGPAGGRLTCRRAPARTAAAAVPPLHRRPRRAPRCNR